MIYIGLWQAGGRLWSATKEEDVRTAVRKALELGLTRFDTAEVYGWGKSERLLGSMVRGVDEVFIVSKVAGFRWREDDIVKAAKRIKERLGRDSVDLLLSHWPPPFYASICRVVHGLEEAVENGYANSIGVSNFSSKQLEEAVHCTKKYEVKTDQIQYNLAYRTPELDLIPLSSKYNVRIMAWSPLAKGGLVSPRKGRELARASDPVYKEVCRDKVLHELLEFLSSELGLTKAQVAIAWLSSRNVDPVVGVRKPEHVEDLAEIKDYVMPGWAVHKLDEASKRYVEIWGSLYKPLRKMRFIPGFLQSIAIRLFGGV